MPFFKNQAVCKIFFAHMTYTAQYFASICDLRLQWHFCNAQHDYCAMIMLIA